MHPETCFEAFVEIGESAFHDFLHINVSDPQDGKQHGHFYKKNFEPVSYAEYECLIKNIKDGEKEHTICKDGINNCILPDKAVEDFSQQYKPYSEIKANIYIKQQEAEKEINAQIVDKSIMLGKNFLDAFAYTLIQHYVKPYMMQNGYSHKNILRFCNVLQAMLLGILSYSPLQAGICFLIKKGLDYAFKAIGIDSSAIQELASGIGTVVAIVENPLSLGQLGVGSCLASYGIAAAYQMIELLPKLRVEPEDTHPNSETCVVNQPKHSSKNLRRRS